MINWTLNLYHKLESVMNKNSRNVFPLKAFTGRQCLIFVSLFWAKCMSHSWNQHCNSSCIQRQWTFSFRNSIYWQLAGICFKILFPSKGQWKYGPTLCLSIDIHIRSNFYSRLLLSFFLTQKTAQKQTKKLGIPPRGTPALTLLLGCFLVKNTQK